MDEMVDEMLLPVMRDGAGFLEVGQRTLELLGALADQVPEARSFLETRADEAMERAKEKMSAMDYARLEACRSAAFG